MAAMLEIGWRHGTRRRERPRSGELALDVLHGDARLLLCCVGTSYPFAGRDDGGGRFGASSRVERP
jgi:hypothetical protein